MSYDIHRSAVPII